MRKRSIALVLGLLAGLLVVPLSASAQGSAEICDTDSLVEAVQGGGEEGTLEGMADDPVGTAASNNPVLTTLTQAATAAGLVDALNSAESLTVFAPTDCAFAELDPATLEAAMADPSGLLTTVLGYHVIPGERLTEADLSGDFETFTGEMITVDGTDVDGQAMVVVPDIETANATVHLIDTVMMPPSMMETAQADGVTEGETEMEATEAEPTEEMTEAEPTEEMTEAEPTEEMTAEATEEMTPTPTPVAEPAGDTSEAPSGGVGTGGGGTANNSFPIPLVIVGLLGILALGAAVVARRSA